MNYLCIHTTHTRHFSTLLSPHLFRILLCLFPILICRPAVCRPARSWGRHLRSPMSCGKFVFPSHYLPLPILGVPSPVVNSSSHLIIPATSHLGSPMSCLEVPCHVVNSSSHLIAGHFPSWTCHFPFWTSHLLW